MDKSFWDMLEKVNDLATIFCWVVLIAGIGWFLLHGLEIVLGLMLVRTQSGRQEWRYPRGIPGALRGASPTRRDYRAGLIPPS